MNGFDKAVESLYARNATPITDGTAVRGLRLLGRGLPKLGDGDRSEETLHDAIVGTVLAQYGALGGRTSPRQSSTRSVTASLAATRSTGRRPRDHRTLRAPIHLRQRRRSPRAAGRRSRRGRERNGRQKPRRQSSTPLRRSATRLGLPSRLRSIDDMTETDLPAIAADVADDVMMANAPEGLEPTEAELEAVLRDAW